MKARKFKFIMFLPSVKLVFYQVWKQGVGFREKFKFVPSFTGEFDETVLICVDNNDMRQKQVKQTMLHRRILVQSAIFRNS